MDIQIIPGTLEHLAECKQALLHSEIGHRYFTDTERADRFLREGLTKQEIFVAVHETGDCLGYIWFALQGTFYSFPYVRNLIVKEEYRSQGVGKALLDFFHAEGFATADCVFLTVSDFNQRAKRFYEANGYVEVGLLPDLVLPGVSERIMMKKR